MPTNFEYAVEGYLRGRKLSGRTQDEYVTTLKKWKEWGGGVSIEYLGRQNIRSFLDWVYERAVTEEGTNPGRTANKA